jgi:hypothetical protein
VIVREGFDGVLLEDELHLIRSAGRVVWCHVRIPRTTLPSAGAEAAKRVCQYLSDNVLHRRSPWLGLILDVRQGPSVFGPITRQVSAKMFECAEQARKPLAVVTVGDGAQHAQYLSLAAAHAPSFALITSDAAKAADWMTQAH